MALYFRYIIFYLLLFFFFANQQYVFGIHHNKIIQSLQYHQFVIGYMYHALYRVNYHYIISRHRVMEIIFFEVFIGAGPRAQIAPAKRRGYYIYIGRFFYYTHINGNIGATFFSLA